jgi:1,2-diacylglycerol-3-alpha-glucose alpha-1,2-glucosyltransferase
VIHVHFPAPTLLPVLNLARARKIPIVYHVHSIYDDTVNSFKGDVILANYIRMVGRSFSKLADALIVPTPYTERVIKKDKWDTKGKVHIISSGVDTKKFRYRRQSKIKGRAVVGALSTVMARKGPDFFTKTASYLPEHVFAWFGKILPMQLYSGRKDMKKILDDKPANAFFHGYVNSLQAAYGLMDIFTSFSIAETDGLPPLEAAAMGIPMVLRSIPPYRERFKDAALFAKTPKEAAAHVKNLLGSERLREKLRKNAREVTKKLDADKCVDKIVVLYESLIKNCSA